MIFCQPANGVCMVLLAAALTASSLAQSTVLVETNVAIRVMAANLTSGNFQSYETPGINIFKGLKPDVVAIQEFRYGSSSAEPQLRGFVDVAFGSQFFFYREPYTGSGDIPNGIVSRWPIIRSGSWDDPSLSNRGFAWAQIDIPGTNDLYIVSVHLYSDSASTRNAEANVIKNQVAANFPAGAWVIIAGDLNTGSRGEAAIATFTTFLTDNPVPADESGDEDTNSPRTQPYDYVLPSPSLQTNLTAVRIGAQTFTRGLVFDSRRYVPLSDVSPVDASDSAASGMQHMAVLKDFRIAYTITNESTLPIILAQPADRAAGIGSNAVFSVTAVGAQPLAFQWYHENVLIPGRTSNSCGLTNVQPADAGSYFVVVANEYGSATSSNALLSVGAAPSIVDAPQSRTVDSGQNVEFLVGADGATPLAFQWSLNGTALPGATVQTLSLQDVKPAQAGDYMVLVTNLFGSALSAAAKLTVNSSGGTPLAQWNFNNTNGALASPPPSLGAGTITLIGGTTAAWVGGSGSTDPATPNNAWNTTTYPAVNAGNKTAGALFRASTVGYRKITVRWDQRVSNTGSKYLRLQYSTNGTGFLDFPSAVQQHTAAIFEPKTNNLTGLPGTEGNPNFAFRIVSEFESTAAGTGADAYVGAGGSYGSAGTVRFDMVTISGVPKGNGAEAAILLSPAYEGPFSFKVSGTAGSNYVIQVAPVPASEIWVPILTNPAPFTFTDSDALKFPQRFYRAVSPP